MLRQTDNCINMFLSKHSLGTRSVRPMLKLPQKAHKGNLTFRQMGWRECIYAFPNAQKQSWSELYERKFVIPYNLDKQNHQQQFVDTLLTDLLLL